MPFWKDKPLGSGAGMHPEVSAGASLLVHSPCVSLETDPSRWAVVERHNVQVRTRMGTIRLTNIGIAA